MTENAFDPRDLLKTLTPDQVTALIDMLTVHDPLVNANVAADYLGVTVATMNAWERYNTGPPCVRLPSAIGTKNKTAIRRWRLSVLHAWLLTYETRPVSGYRYPRSKLTAAQAPVETFLVSSRLRGGEDP